ALLPAAIAASDRAYIFDNSGSQSVCIAEIIGGQDLALKTDAPPAWFRRAYLDTL
ncbi:MAG: putative ABC-type ATPase, partial [Rhodothermales bacterium]